MKSPYDSLIFFGGHIVDVARPIVCGVPNESRISRRRRYQSFVVVELLLLDVLSVLDGNVGLSVRRYRLSEAVQALFQPVYGVADRTPIFAPGMPSAVVHVGLPP